MGFGSVLKAMFPFINAAASLGGPPAVIAANMIGKALGIDKVQPTPEGIESAITAAQAKDPEILLKLKQVEADFQLKMKELGIESVEHLEQIGAADRDSARKREMAVKDRTPAQLGWLIIIVCFLGDVGVLFLALKYASTITTVQVAVVMSVLKTWEALALCVGYYYYGSSSGSDKKNETIQQALENK